MNSLASHSVPVQISQGDLHTKVLVFRKKRTESRFQEIIGYQISKLKDPDRKIHIKSLRDIHDMVTRNSEYRRLKKKHETIVASMSEGSSENGSFYDVFMGEQDKRNFENIVSALNEIENLLIDERAVKSLEGIRCARGLEIIALHHDHEDGVPAVMALGRLEETGALETIAQTSNNPWVATDAVIEIKKLTKLDGEDSLGDPYSSGAYKISRIIPDANTYEARVVAFISLGELASEEGALGDSAKNYIKWLKANDIEVKIPDEITGITGNGIRERDDGEYESHAWSRWAGDGRLEKLIEDIETVAQNL